MAHEEQDAYSEIDQVLGGRIHEAFDAVEPSAAARERMFAQLASYRDQKTVSAEASSGADGSLLPDAVLPFLTGSVFGEEITAPDQPEVPWANDTELPLEEQTLVFGPVEAVRAAAGDVLVEQETAQLDPVAQGTDREKDAAAPLAAAAGLGVAAGAGLAAGAEWESPAQAASLDGQPEAAAAHPDASRAQADELDVPAEGASVQHEGADASTEAAEAQPVGDDAFAEAGAAQREAADEADAVASEPSRRVIAPWKIAVPAAAAVAALGIGLFAWLNVPQNTPLFSESAADKNSAAAKVGSAEEEAVSEDSPAQGSTTLDLSNMGSSSSSSSSSARPGTGLTTYDANANSGRQTQTTATIETTNSGGSSQSSSSSSAGGSGGATIVVDNGGSGSGSTVSPTVPIAQDTVVNASEQTAADVGGGASYEVQDSGGGSTYTPQVESYTPAENAAAPAETVTTTEPEVVIVDTSKSSWGRDYPNITLSDGAQLVIAGGQENGARVWDTSEVGDITPDVFSGTASGSGGSTSVTVYQSYTDGNTYLVMYTPDTGFFVAHPR